MPQCFSTGGGKAIVCLERVLNVRNLKIQLYVSNSYFVDTAHRRTTWATLQVLDLTCPSNSLQPPLLLLLLLNPHFTHQLSSFSSTPSIHAPSLHLLALPLSSPLQFPPQDQAPHSHARPLNPSPFLHQYRQESIQFTVHANLPSQT